MEERTLDPYPWPDDELCLWFGRTAYYAHQFEREFKLFLLAAEANGRITIDRKKAASSEDYLFSKALGAFEAILRRGGGFSDDPEFERRMIAAREARNEIAHNLFQNYDPSLATSKDRVAIIERLKKLRFDVGIGFLNIRELRKFAEETIGITEEQLTEMLARLEG